MMRPFSLLIKPSSADCNLNCHYCFYLKNYQLYPDQKIHRMSNETLDIMISSYMKTEQPAYSFGWQGGEPTLMGVDFFRQVVALQQKYGRFGAVVSNGVQTNGTLLTDELVEHFAKYKFLLGVSLDGPANIHNAYRQTIGGQDTHSLVMDGIKMLKKYQVEFNILILVNSKNVTKAKEIYNYYIEQGFNYLQFIPCVEYDNNNQLLPFAINAQQWGEFLCEIYDIWKKSDVNRVSIRYFDTLMELLVTGNRNVCQIGNNCCQYLVVEHNGDVYPCDFFVKKDLRIGNVAQNSWEFLQKSPIYTEFGKQKTCFNTTCSNCEYLYYCNGDCLKHRIYGSGSDPKRLSSLCQGYKMFFEHSLDGFKELANQIKAQRASVLEKQSVNNSSNRKNIGRNDKCYCGSGKKYKKCCGK